MKTFGKIFYYLVVGFILLVAVLVMANKFSMPGKVKLYVVQSGSMEPNIRTGSLVVVKPVKEYKINDVITFGQESKNKAPTTHRIKDIRMLAGNPAYLTKGDANENADTKEISNKEIIGKVYFTVPFIGYLLTAAKQPVGFMVLIVIPATIIIYDELRKIVAEVGRVRAKKSEEQADVINDEDTDK